MELIAIGTVRTARGVKGWLKLSSFSGEWSHFADLAAVTLKARDRDRKREYEVEGFQMNQGSGLIKLVGVDTPEAGKTLAGYEILVPKESAAPLDENEWYLRDLIGLSVVDDKGMVLGEIVSMVESADDLLEIRKPDGKLFMIPFRSRFVEEPDMEKRTMVLNALWLMDES